jgi:hypothetical protein
VWFAQSSNHYCFAFAISNKYCRHLPLPHPTQLCHCHLGQGMGSLSTVVIKTVASFLWQLLLAFFRAYAPQMTLRGRFLGSEFKWVYCWLTGMKADAVVSAIYLDRVRIIIRQLCYYWHLSHSSLSNRCCNFCWIPFLGYKVLDFARNFVEVTPLAGERMCQTAVCQNLGT